VTKVNEKVCRQLYNELIEPSGRFVAIRHATSHKNIAAIHGGGGMRLADVGIVEAKRTAEILGQRGFDRNSKIVTANIVQAKETADTLGKYLGCAVTVDNLLVGIHLGVLHSLPEKQAWSDHPDSMTLLDDWRRGLFPIDRLRLPDAESPATFCKRLTNALHVHVAQGADIFIATRSTMIVLANLVTGEGSLNLSAYYASSWNPCEALLFENGEARREQF
jgi:broad specificity phosphatase PhoE